MAVRNAGIAFSEVRNGVISAKLPSIWTKSHLKKVFGLIEESFKSHDRQESRNHYLKRGCRFLDGWQWPLAQPARGIRT
jgi:hypothetical protein